MNRADACRESRVGARPGRGRPLAPRVVATGGDGQHPAHCGNPVDGLIRVHESERRDGTEPVSVANQAAGFCQYRALFAQHPVLTAQPVKLRALIGGQTAAAQTFIETGLLDPLTNGIGGRLKLASELVDTAAGLRQFDDLAPVFRGIWRMASRHGDTPSSFIPNTVYGNGSTPRYLVLGELPGCAGCGGFPNTRRYFFPALSVILRG